MTTHEAAARLGSRINERQQCESVLAELSGLRARAQFVRLGNRHALSSLGTGCVYIAAKGVVGLEASFAGSDVRVVTTLLYPGDIVVPELQAPLPGLTLISQRPGEFWKLPGSVFGEEMGRGNQLWQTVFTRLNEQNARAQLHSTAMSILNSEERVAGFLIEAGTRLGTSPGSTIAFELPLSRYSIADYLSLNADTISRTFSALAAARIIERRGRFQLVVRDWPALVDRCPLSGPIIAMHGGEKSKFFR